MQPWNIIGMIHVAIKPCSPCDPQALFQLLDNGQGFIFKWVQILDGSCLSVGAQLSRGSGASELLTRLISPGVSWRLDSIARAKRVLILNWAFVWGIAFMDCVFKVVVDDARIIAYTHLSKSEKRYSSFKSLDVRTKKKNCTWAILGAGFRIKCFDLKVLLGKVPLFLLLRDR